MDSGTAGDAEGAGDAALAAREFRVSLEHRRDIDDLVADAVAVRQRATVDAAEIVRNAEALAREIVGDAQKEAARLTAEAEETLEAAAARHDLADAALGEQVSATIGRLESMASDVQMVLDSALAEVAESLAPVAERWHPAPTAVPDPSSESRRTDVESGAESAPWTAQISAHQVRGAAEARHDRWRDRFRQAL